MVEKILLDTDIGSDIDDAVCMAYLLAQPQCDILGITTVTGEADKRAMMASALCKAAGVDISIYPGVEEPLLVPQRQKSAPQASALDKWEHEEHFPRGQAIEFLQKTIRNQPGEITLLAIGPLTNVSLLFSVDPEIPTLLKRLVMMGGLYYPYDKDIIERAIHLEWNTSGDPHATAIVFNHPAPINRTVGLEITTRVSMSSDQVRQSFQHQLLEPVLDFAEIWFESIAQKPTLIFHDPLAAVMIFDPDIFAFERGTVEVELASERLKGLTSWTKGTNGPHEIAVAVDLQRFFDHFFAVFH